MSSKHWAGLATRSLQLLTRHWVLCVQVDEVKEKLLSGSESSRAMREVRTRDPHFDLNYFVRAIKV